MQIVNTIKELQEILNKKKEKSVGFVPTMGALHSGHVSLVTKCVNENDITVVSVFVNPTQFNDKSDFDRYPITPEADIQLLEKANCDIVFMPAVSEMYPTEDTRTFNFGSLETVMEGAFRPGHFNGVAQIVSKLFYAVTPNKAYFGEKDFQQLAIIREMVKQLNLDIEIIGCPIIREQSGLARSSRNTLLTDDQREKAANIYRILKEITNFAQNLSVAEIQEYVNKEIHSSYDQFKLDYFEIVDGLSLQSVNNFNDSNYIVACIAVYCGKIRLIDNIRIK